MPAGAKRSRGPSLTPNLTPMVDVVFLLIVFFVLVAQITSAERVEMPLSEVERMMGIDQATDQRRVVVNILPAGSPGSERTWCRVGSLSIPHGRAGAALLTEALAQIRRADPEAHVTIRAARDESYDRVHPALEACREAGVARANLAALERDG